jgi:hypothetical protein
MVVPVLTTEMITVFPVLGLVIVLLVFNLLRVDVIGLEGVTLLPITDRLTAREAAAIASAIMSNVGCASLMLPAVLQISRKSKIPASKLVMPMGFCASMGAISPSWAPPRLSF